MQRDQRLPENAYYVLDLMIELSLEYFAMLK